jgi:hypothetical protein
MLIDGISLVDSSVIANSHVESGTAFPSSATLGRMFYLNAAFAGNEPGLYVYNGTTWITGDITSVTVGTGLIGGGSSGDLSIGVDTSVIATKSYTDTQVAAVQATVSGLSKASLGLDLVENKNSATIRSEITSSNVTTALGFTPYNATNPSSFINLNQSRQGIGAGTGISYDSATGFVSLNASTSIVTEGTNLYFTNARARAAISATGSLAYNTATGVISYTAPTSGTGSGDFKSDGSVAMTGSLVAANGSVASPAIKIGKDIQNNPTGFYAVGDDAGTVGFVVGGVARLFFNNAGLQGNPAAPAHIGVAPGGYYGWVGDQLTGFDYATTGTFNLRSSNSIVAKVAPTGFAMQAGKDLTLSANPTSSLHAATKQYVDSAVAVMDGGLF